MPKQLKFLKKYVALELWFTLENYDTFGEKNYDTVPETMELWFTMEKNGTKEKTILL